MLPGVGVFGTSLTARVIIPLLKDEGFAVKALWGRTQEEAEELAKEMSVPFYTSRIDEVLLHQDVDLVCINLPPPLTRQIAVKTLGERPPSLSPPAPSLPCCFSALAPSASQRLTRHLRRPGDLRCHMPLGAPSFLIPGLPCLCASLLPSGTTWTRLPTCVARRLEEACVPGLATRRIRCGGLGRSRSREEKTKSAAVPVVPRVCAWVRACERRVRGTGTPE